MFKWLRRWRLRRMDAEDRMGEVSKEVFDLLYYCTQGPGESVEVLQRTSATLVSHFIQWRYGGPDDLKQHSRRILRVANAAIEEEMNKIILECEDYNREHNNVVPLERK
jgi:hypothetical protein